MKTCRPARTMSYIHTSSSGPVLTCQPVSSVISLATHCSGVSPGLQAPARQLPFRTLVLQQQHPSRPDDHALDRDRVHRPLLTVHTCPPHTRVAGGPPRPDPAAGATLAGPGEPNTTAARRPGCGLCSKVDNLSADERPGRGVA